MVPSAIFKDVTDPSANFIVTTAPSDILSVVTELLLSLFAITAPSLILMDTMEPSASLTAVIEPSKITGLAGLATGFTEAGAKILGAIEMMARVVIRESIQVTAITGSIFLRFVDISDNLLSRSASFERDKI